MYLNGKETKRLRFRKIEESDAAIWEGFFINNSSEEYLGLDLTMSIKDQSADWIKIQLQRYKDKRYGLYALIEIETGNYIGQCGLLAQKIENNNEIEIGYHLIPKYWGRGFGTEAAQGCRNFAFENNICDSLISIIDIRNNASQNVATKNGMKNTKQLRLYDLDVYLFRIKREEWELIKSVRL
jgi:RimJ/RimL family protein N-acetyltransferase